MKAIDPIDLAVSRAFHGSVCRPMIQSPGARMLEEALSAAAETIPPKVENIASLIYSYDQNSLDKPWHRLNAAGRELFYEIARAVLKEAA